MKPIHLFLLILVTISCKSQDNNHIITFNLKDLPKISEVKLSDLGFEDIEYIPLETNEQCIISKTSMKLELEMIYFLVKFI